MAGAVEESLEHIYVAGISDQVQEVIRLIKVACGVIQLIGECRKITGTVVGVLQCVGAGRVSDLRDAVLRIALEGNRNSRRACDPVVTDGDGVAAGIGHPGHTKILINVVSESFGGLQREQRWVIDVQVKGDQVLRTGHGAVNQQ